jgi:hypothetical protein
VRSRRRVSEVLEAIDAEGLDHGGPGGEGGNPLGAGLA